MNRIQESAWEVPGGKLAVAEHAAAVPAARELRGNGRKAIRRLHLWLKDKAHSRA